MILWADKFLLTGLLAGAALAAHPATADPMAYTVTEIPTLGGARGEALGLNNLGQVVGWAELVNGDPHAFRWDAGGIVDLGTLGGNESYAYDINDAGRIVGQSEAVDVPSFRFAFLMDPGDSSQTPLTNLPNTGNAVARTVNPAGDPAGSSLTIDELDAVIWDPDTTAIQLLPSFLDEPLAQGDVWDSNIENDLVGWSKIIDTGSGYVGMRAAMWPGGQPQGSLIEIGTLGGSFSQARGINDAKQVVGMAGLAVPQIHAFLWKNGSIQDLGDLGDGITALFSVAQDINDAGQVVGYSASPLSASFRAFLWENGSMVDLNTLIPSGSGWELTHANAINSAGQIVGKGISPMGQERAFLLSPAGMLTPPGVTPDMTVEKLDAAGSNLRIHWNPAACAGAAGYQILFGGGSGFPATPGGGWALDGAECGIGLSSPFSWQGSPVTNTDPNGLIWWIIVATDGNATEGSWGLDSDNVERDNAAGAASFECGTTLKELSNNCP